MNILPLVSALLFILALLTGLLIEQKISTSWEEKSASGYLHAQREMRTHIERKHYTAVAGEDEEEKKKKREKELKEIEYKSKREKVDLHEASRLNIYSLLQKERSSDRIYEVAARLILLLYGEADFFKEAKGKVLDLEYRLLDQIIEQGIANPDAVSFDELRPPDLFFSALFYKMMQGTNTYDVKKHQGYPPLKDFFFIEKGKKPVLFYFSSQPLFVAFFGEKLAADIRAIEKTKWEKDHKHHTVTKKELTELLLKNPAQKMKIEQIEEFINFSNKSGLQSSAIGHDSKTGIRLKQELSR